MVEVTRLDRETAPKKRGVDYVKRKQKVEKSHSYAHENIRRTKYDKERASKIHHVLEEGITFWQVVSDDDWNKIFKKGSKTA